MIKNLFKMTRGRLALDAVLVAILLGITVLFVSVLWMPLQSYRGPFKATQDSEKTTEALLREYAR